MAPKSQAMQSFVLDQGKIGEAACNATNGTIDIMVKIAVISLCTIFHGVKRPENGISTINYNSGNGGRKCSARFTSFHSALQLESIRARLFDQCVDSLPIQSNVFVAG